MFTRPLYHAMATCVRQSNSLTRSNLPSLSFLHLSERSETSKQAMRLSSSNLELSLPKPSRQLSTQKRTRRPREVVKKNVLGKGRQESSETVKETANEELEELPQWEFDKPSELSYTREDQEPTPILDAYERSRDPAELERLLQMSYDALPPRAGPRRNNHKRRQHQKFRTVRNIKYKAKAQQMEAYERKLQKRRDRKEREAALFATWRGSDETNVSMTGSASQAS